ncbi:MAG TPA: serine hydrolase [Candidatus Coprenecus merdipullorum]|nr:serine hydrolase [Candidatus Coprenecus merdipullorum]
MKTRAVPHILLPLLLFCLLPLASRAQTGRDIPSEISAYAEQVRTQWKIPGLSLAVVHGDSLVFSGGFGVREKGKTIDGDGEWTAVTDSTLFHIGSMTKAFTAAVIASLVDEGLLRWDDTVKHILPDFDWYDDSVEAVMQVRDLLTHSTGLVAQAGTYIPNLGYDRDDIYRMFRYIEPVYPFREKFAYNNITFIIAARIIETVTGRSWEDNIRERIFIPLGMNSSVPGSEGYLQAEKKASVAHYFGYSRGRNGSRGSIYVTPLYGEERALHWVDVIGPAGSISSTAADMARWVRFHLNNGAVICTVEPEDNGLISSFPMDSTAFSEYFPDMSSGLSGEFRFYPYQDTVQVISRRQMDFLHTGVIKVRQDSTMRRDYAYCWYVEQNERYKVIYHTGTTWGFTGVCGFVPELDLGVAVLCNSEVSEYARLGLMRRIIDLYLPGDTLRDWSTEGLEQWFADKKKPGRRAVPCTIRRSSTDPDPARLVGHYTKPAPFGDAEVTLKNGKLYLTIGPLGWTHRLDHHRGNEFWLRSDGHTYPVFFHNYTEGSSGPVDFEIDFNYNENFGPWIKTP